MGDKHMNGSWFLPWNNIGQNIVEQLIYWVDSFLGKNKQTVNPELYILRKNILQKLKKTYFPCPFFPSPFPDFLLFPSPLSSLSQTIQTWRHQLEHKRVDVFAGGRLWGAEPWWLKVGWEKASKITCSHREKTHSTEKSDPDHEEKYTRGRLISSDY